MITAKLQGRRLVLEVETEADEEAVAPFFVTPLSARAGRELSMRYMYTMEGLPVEAGSVENDMRDAFGADNIERADSELSSHEGETMSLAAYFWQSVGGLEAVRELLAMNADGIQGDDVSRGKALAVFRLRMVPLLSRIRHHLESARQTLAESSPDTSTQSGSETSANAPAETQNGQLPAFPPIPSTSGSSSTPPNG